LGINLHSATRIVLFDVCWNPAEDQQAIFRAYRYGQTKPVCVYRLISAGDIEENIWKRCISKTWLFRRVVDEKTPARMLTKDDLNLYEFQQNQQKILDNKVDYDVIKGDKLILSVATEMGVGINRILEHESLFIDDDDEKISEEDKTEARKDYEDSKRFATNHLSSLNSEMTRNKQLMMGGKHKGMTLEELKLAYSTQNQQPILPSFQMQSSGVDSQMKSFSNSMQFQPKQEYSKMKLPPMKNFQFIQENPSQPEMLQQFHDKIASDFLKSPIQSGQTGSELVPNDIDLKYLREIQQKEKEKTSSAVNTFKNKVASLDSLLSNESVSPTKPKDIIEID
jgi:hypothetical protein